MSAEGWQQKEREQKIGRGGDVKVGECQVAQCVMTAHHVFYCR